MTRSLLASAALYWYLRAHGQDAITFETAANVLGGTEGQVKKIKLDERLRVTPKTIRLAGEKSNAKWTAADEREVFDAWVAVTGRTAATKLTPDRRSLIAAAFRAGYTKQEQLWAVEGLGVSDWHMGRNPKTKGRRFDELKYALKDGATIEERIEQAGHGRQAAPSARPAPSPTPVDAPAVEWSPPAIQRERFVCWHCGDDSSYPHTPPSGMPGPPVCKACFTHVCDSGALPDVSCETRGLF